MVKVFTDGLGNRGSMSYQRIKKMVLDAALFSTPHYKVQVKSNVERSREWDSALPYNSV